MNDFVNTSGIEFFALPVGKGDSFLLRTESMAILVDGGQSVRTEEQLLTELFQSGTKKLDVVICTHNDSDHAKGLQALFNCSCHIKVDNLYLPLEFKNFKDKPRRIEDKLFQELVVFFFARDLFRNNTNARQLLINIFEKSIQREVHAIEGRIGNIIYEPQDEELEKILLDGINPLLAPECSNQHSKSLNFSFRKKDISFPKNSLSFFLCWYLILLRQQEPNVVKMQNCIEKIIHKAFQLKNNIQDLLDGYIKKKNHGAVRFFKHLPYGNTSAKLMLESSSLIPMNCIEIPHTLFDETNPQREDEISYLSSLALSEDNRRSLVFYKPVKGESFGVLFCADSDLKSLPKVKLASSLLATAPHHGSEKNIEAYKIVQNLSNEVSWVRSDGLTNNRRTHDRPCPPFRLAKHKDCVCRDKTNSKMVKVILTESGWNYVKGECMHTGAYCSLPLSIGGCHK